MTPAGFAPFDERFYAVRTGMQGAVVPDYPARLARFLRARNSHLAGLMPADLSV